MSLLSWPCGPGTCSLFRLGGRVRKLAVRALSVCCLVVLLGAAPAQDKKPEKKKPKDDPINAAFAFPRRSRSTRNSRQSSKS